MPVTFAIPPASWRTTRRTCGSSCSNPGRIRRILQSVDEIAKLLRGMDSDRAAGDPQGLQQLAATALDKLTKFEWDLRKRVDTSNDALYVPGSEDVPSNYKDLIEQYYRALSKKKSGGGK